MTDLDYSPEQDLEKNRAENERLAQKCATELAKIRRTCAGCDWQHHCEDIRRADLAHRRAEYTRRNPPASYTPELYGPDARDGDW